MILVLIFLQAVMLLQPATAGPRSEEQTSKGIDVSPAKLIVGTPSNWNERAQGQSVQSDRALGGREPQAENTGVARNGKARHFLQASEIESAISKSLASYSGSISVKVVDLATGSYPDGYLEFNLSGAVVPPLARPTSPFLWRGHEISVEGNWIPVWARVQVTTLRQLVRIRVNLPAGRVLAANDLESFQATTCPLLVRQDDQPKNYEGMLLRRSLRSGSQLVPDLVKTPPTIERGSIVPVQASVGRADIRFEAEADLSGYPGQTIQLTNTTSKRHFRGIVQADGSVLVRAYMVQRKAYRN
jgi:flagella basal body P-ring formation protein FlgA